MHLEIMNRIQRATSLKSQQQQKKKQQLPIQSEASFWPSFVTYLKQISHLLPNQTYCYP